MYGRHWGQHSLSWCVNVSPGWQAIAGHAVFVQETVLEKHLHALHVEFQDSPS